MTDTPWACGSTCSQRKPSRDPLIYVAMPFRRGTYSQRENVARANAVGRWLASWRWRRCPMPCSDHECTLPTAIREACPDHRDRTEPGQYANESTPLCCADPDDRPCDRLDSPCLTHPT